LSYRDRAARAAQAARDALSRFRFLKHFGRTRESRLITLSNSSFIHHLVFAPLPSPSPQRVADRPFLSTSLRHLNKSPSLFTMAEEIRIDKQTFQDRLAHFIQAWKTDKRSGDALFNGAGSIVILMGKSEESSAFQKNNSMHVSFLRLIFFVFYCHPGPARDWTLRLTSQCWHISFGSWATNFRLH
jgi:hypothetical protein